MSNPAETKRDIVQLAGEYFVERKVTNVTAQMAISGFALWAAERLAREPREGHAWYGVEGAASGQWSGLPIKDVICMNCKRVRPLLDCLNDPLPCVPPPRETGGDIDDGECKSCKDGQCTAGPECVAMGQDDFPSPAEVIGLDLAMRTSPPTTPGSQP
jgi:hypothetical protein